MQKSNLIIDKKTDKILNTKQGLTTHSQSPTKIA